MLLCCGLEDEQYTGCERREIFPVLIANDTGQWEGTDLVFYTRNNSLIVNTTNEECLVLSSDMEFNDAHLISIIVHSILIIFSTIGNTTVLVNILR